MPQQYFLASCLVVLYLLFCGFFLRSGAKGSGRAKLPAVRGNDTVLLAYASQGGEAQRLAHAYARILPDENEVVVASLNQIDDPLLQKVSLAIFIVSTYGEGEPPDNALAFTRKCLAESRGEHLSHLHFAVLALGDSQYRQFCAFGMSVYRGLSRQGAKALFDVVKVDGLNTEHLTIWENQLLRHGLSGGSIARVNEQSSATFERWSLQQRTVLNPGSCGGAVWHVRLQAKTGSQCSSWQAGDIAQVLPHNDPQYPVREYSIASIPEEGSMELLVRQVVKDDGSMGLGSGWLTDTAGARSDIMLRVRTNPAFHAPPVGRPMILIGNGTGLAGLRAHLQARERAGAHRNCLFFGERNQAHDFLFRRELRDWQQRQHLPWLYLAFSRDQAEKHYVQHLLLEQADLVRGWVDDGAVIYICGSRQGMAAAVNEALEAILGTELLDELLCEDRLRRDVY